MSADNFWYVKGNKVYMGDASEYAELFEQAEKVFESGYKQRLERKRPYHEAATHEQALGWALNEYSEYGIYWIDEADS